MTDLRAAFHALLLGHEVKVVRPLTSYLASPGDPHALGFACSCGKL